jgi:23S rRNA pseudouridine1911/1915/1917 synthase
MNKRRPGTNSKPGPVPVPPAAGRARSWEGLVGPGGALRADAYIAETAGVLSRSQIKARAASLLVNGAAAKLSRPLKEGDRLELRWIEEPQEGIEAEDIPLAVIYEDDSVIVVDKAQGMVTHPGAGNRRGTLANALLFRALSRTKVEGDASALVASLSSARAGIVHRLDKDTSGLIVAAKDVVAQAFLAAQFKDRLAKKEYLAIVKGIPSPAAGRITDRLSRDKRNRKRFAAVAEGGKVAVTDYHVLATWSSAPRGTMPGERYAYVSLRPKTGRTHQLRVHMAGLGTPILGDPIYGKKDGRFPGATLMLHAYRLKIALPGHEESVLFKARLPERFMAMIEALDQAIGQAISVGSVMRQQ